MAILKPRVAIANRGEVALRVIRACQEMGFQSILLHSTPDKETTAYRIADETLELPGNSATETYLNIPLIVDAVKSARAQFLHPGFGFLSENADFAAALENEKIKFIGPSSQAIALAGNKIRAKELAIKSGVPTVPSNIASSAAKGGKILDEAKKIGFPCIIKAAAGGGGKGMKVVRQENEFAELFASAQREAKSAFGNDQVFIEKYLEKPRHVEVQILCDEHGHRFHFYERDCTVQRRHQKIFEETPALLLDDSLRERITSAALKIASAAHYTNAGTVEFLVDEKKNFYFMELNTRLQVEHTVTEMTCGVDLVKMQFAVALGEELDFKQNNIQPRGHALEVRIYAENPEQEFLPSTGKLLKLALPLGPHRRFDFGYEEGDSITSFYDPMIGKIITWAPTREENLKRMHATLSETVIFGVRTNIEFLKSVLLNGKFQSNSYSTRFLEEEYANGFQGPTLTPDEQAPGITIDRRPPSPVTSESNLCYESPWVGMGKQK